MKMLSAKGKELYKKELFKGEKNPTLISLTDFINHTRHWIGRVNVSFVLEVKAQQFFQKST